MAIARWSPRALAAAAALGLVVPSQASAQQEHAQHQHPAPAQPAASPAPRADTAAARVPIPVRASFAAGPVGAVGSREAKEKEELEVRLRLTDPGTGRPITGLSPMAWVDVRRGGAETPHAACQQRVGSFVEATLHVKHGEINITQPVDDLNGHYVVALARGGNVVVIDPVKGFGRTRMLTAVPLGAEGGDWAATEDDRRIFVTLPARGEVAVVNTHTWRVEKRIPAGARPTTARMAPDGRLWVSDAGAGVVVIDAERLEAVGTVPAGAGPHAIAFSDDGKTAFVAARAAGTVTVVDAATLRKVAEPKVGAAPVDVAWSSVRKAAFVVDEAAGSLAVMDPAGTVVERVAFQPGLRSIRIAPDAAQGHGAHMGHGGDHGAGNGRLAFLLNPRGGTLEIYDLVDKRIIRTLSGAPEPDQVAFTGQFAYIRAAGTASVALIPLANPTSGAIGPHDYFSAGSTAPGPIAADSLGDVLIPQPGMHDAIYAANPRERMVYSYHYMEGMPVPHGGLTTYGFTPKAVRVVSRRVRETEPGVYAATLKIDRPGDYDLIFRSPDPYVLGCFGFSVARDPSLRTEKDVKVAAEPAEARVGRWSARFRVSDAEGDRPIEGLADFRVLLASTSGFQQRAEARAVGQGVYEATFDVAEPGLYYATFEIPSRGVTLRDLAPASFQVRQ